MACTRKDEATMKTYTFHVSVPDLPDTWRRVEVAAEQTLRDLHVAIQEALDWDPDDDIAFFVGENPLEDGEQYSINVDEDWDEEDDEGLEDVEAEIQRYTQPICTTRR